MPNFRIINLNYFFIFNPRKDSQFEDYDQIGSPTSISISWRRDETFRNAIDLLHHGLLEVHYFLFAADCS